jgi:hypothetical protein
LNNLFMKRTNLLRLGWRQLSLLPTVILALSLFSPRAAGQLFDNLQAFGSRLKTGDPTANAGNQSLEGPKGIATADFNADGKPDLAVANIDGTVTVFFGETDGQFSSPLHLQTETNELRAIVCADLNGDGRPDIAAAAPYAGAVFLFANLGGGAFDSATNIVTWSGARNLAVGDFDGDGMNDLVVAGTTTGLRQLRGLGGGFQFNVVTNLINLGSANPEFPKPVYSMRSFRGWGSTRDDLIVTHADSLLVWLLSADGPNGALIVKQTIENKKIHSLDVGPLSRPIADGTPDLVSAHRDRGTVEIYQGSLGPIRFSETIYQKIDVPGGPRALEIVDLDGDGWNDLVVVLRNFDRVITYHNSNGVMVAATEMPVGMSPRELVSADFNEDGLPDIAVMNRDSQDVSVLLTYPGQASFGSSDQVYPVDGEVAALLVLDVNADARDDVIQLHRASAEFSVRLAATNGALGTPVFYSMGTLPSALQAIDVNGDGLLDMVTANLGRMESGSISVRLGTGAGGFGPEIRTSLPDGVGGGLFALVAADFDNDGKIDLAAGFFDCRLALFKGNGDGTCTFTRSHTFVYESRVMVAGDFDKDGDMDLAGAGYAGDVVVIENLGDLLTTTNLTRVDYRRSNDGKFGTRDIIAFDVTSDGDLDLLVGSGNGTMLFVGGPGMQFTRVSDALPGTAFPAASVARGDFDGDGWDDLAISCRILSCISILTRDNNGDFVPTLSVDVPAGGFLATGDLDGDGHADLVGSGAVLWTALSSRAGETVPAASLQAQRQTMITPVINELLAINSSLPLEVDGDRFSDWVELHNGSAAATTLSGWKLRLVEAGESGGSITNEFSFPPTAFFASKGHLLVIFSETKRTLYHTGFKLPGNGGTLTLIDPGGAEVDRVQFPAQQENTSYGRYRDGVASWAFNPYPSPGRLNTDNGPVEPVIELNGFDTATFQPDQAIRFFATGRDDVGIVGVSLLYQRLDIPDDDVHRVPLYDDGMNGDGGMLDGLFSGLLQPGLPAGAEIQFFIEVVDLSDRTVIVPDEPVFARAGEPLRLYSLAVGAPRPPVEISELVAFNAGGLVDERGTNTDWVEIRNCSDTPVSLNGLGLSQNFFANSSRFAFSNSMVLNPGQHLVVFCDDNPAVGPLHAPFKINRLGDRLTLTGMGANGARTFIDTVTFGPQTTNVAYARLGCGGEFMTSAPTPRAANVPGAWRGIVRTNGQFTFAFPTITNQIYRVQYKDSLSISNWTSLVPIMGNGVERVLTEPLGSQRFYRVRVGN